MNLRKLTPLAVAATLAVSNLVAAETQAATSAGISMANFYLWHGQNISPDGAQVSGDFKYTDASGAYGKMWTSSEYAGNETDLIFGFANKAGEIAYDVSFIKYLYPSERDGNNLQIGSSRSDAAEIGIVLSTKGATFTYNFNIDSDNDDNSYLTLSYAFGKYTFLYGMTMLDKGTVTSEKAAELGNGAKPGDEYTHLNVSYAATDALTFTIAKAFSDLDKRVDPAAVEEDLLFHVSYDWKFDLNDAKM